MGEYLHKQDNYKPERKLIQSSNQRKPQAFNEKTFSRLVRETALCHLPVLLNGKENSFLAKQQVSLVRVEELPVFERKTTLQTGWWTMIPERIKPQSSWSDTTRWFNEYQWQAGNSTRKDKVTKKAPSFQRQNLFNLISTCPPIRSCWRWEKQLSGQQQDKQKITRGWMLRTVVSWQQHVSLESKLRIKEKQTKQRNTRSALPDSIIRENCTSRTQFTSK